MISKAEARRIALSIPGATEGLHFRKPAIFVDGEFLTRIHDKEDAVVLITRGIEMRDMMLEAEPKLFYITDHYRKFPALLARLTALDARTLRELLAPRMARIAEQAQKPAKGKKKIAKKKTAKKAKKKSA